MLRMGEDFSSSSIDAINYGQTVRVAVLEYLLRHRGMGADNTGGFWASGHADVPLRSTCCVL